MLVDAATFLGHKLSRNQIFHMSVIKLPQTHFFLSWVNLAYLS